MKTGIFFTTPELERLTDFLDANLPESTNDLVLLQAYQKLHRAKP